MSVEEAPRASHDVHRTVETYGGSTVLITGGRGYLGAALTQRLASVDCELVLLDRSPGNAWQPAGPSGPVRFIQADVGQRKTWNQALPNTDYVFHLAAFEHTHGADHDAMRDLEANAISVLHLVETCREQSLSPKIVLASSANIFGCVDSIPVNEDTPDDPRTLFAIHKRTAEHYLRLHTMAGGDRSVSLRLANVYGPTARADRVPRVVINRLIMQALAGESLSLYANRDCVRDYVFIDDVVSAFLLAGSSEMVSDGQYFVIGSEQGHTIADAVRLVCTRAARRTGRESPIRSDSTVTIGPAERRNFVADASRFRDATGWSPTTALEQGVEKTIEALA
jgi:UDP-glucose 4-epimerase